MSDPDEYDENATDLEIDPKTLMQSYYAFAFNPIIPLSDVRQLAGSAYFSTRK